MQYMWNVGCIFTYFPKVYHKTRTAICQRRLHYYMRPLTWSAEIFYKRTFTNLVHNKTNEWKTLKQSQFCPTQSFKSSCPHELPAVSVIAGHVYSSWLVWVCLFGPVCVRWQESPESNCTHHTQSWMTGIPSDLLSLSPFGNHIPLPPVYQC